MGDSKHLKTRPHSKKRISVVYSFSNEYANSYKISDKYIPDLQCCQREYVLRAGTNNYDSILISFRDVQLQRVQEEVRVRLQLHRVWERGQALLEFAPDSRRERWQQASGYRANQESPLPFPR